MDLRDHFAGLAMQVMLRYFLDTRTEDSIARAAYRLADAMLVAREAIQLPSGNGDV